MENKTNTTNKEEVEAMKSIGEYNYLTVDKKLKGKLDSWVITELVKWCEKLKTKINIKVDNRIKGMNANFHTGEIRMNTKKYNLKEDKGYVLQTLLHELFHIKMQHWNLIIKQEYSAENFAIKIIKHFYPEYYNRIVEDIKSNIYNYYKKHYPVHYKAFSQIDDYKTLV
jgi:hypothetical protein